MDELDLHARLVLTAEIVGLHGRRALTFALVSPETARPSQTPATTRPLSHVARVLVAMVR